MPLPEVKLRQAKIRGMWFVALTALAAAERHAEQNSFVRRIYRYIIKAQVSSGVPLARPPVALIRTPCRNAACQWVLEDCDRPSLRLPTNS